MLKNLIKYKTRLFQDERIEMHIDSTLFKKKGLPLNWKNNNLLMVSSGNFERIISLRITEWILKKLKW